MIDDPYFLALYSGALFNVGKEQKALKVSQRVVSSQDIETGAVTGAQSSITSSSGQSLLLETTSLCIINWLNQDASHFSPQIDLGIKFLLSSIKDGGRFGSTQSTVLTLKALVRYSQIYQGIKGSGKISLYVNDVKVHSIPYSDELTNTKFDFSEKLNALGIHDGATIQMIDQKFDFRFSIEDS